jgi:hypothetical protein
LALRVVVVMIGTKSNGRKDVLMFSHVDEADSSTIRYPSYRSPASCWPTNQSVETPFSYPINTITAGLVLAGTVSDKRKQNSPIQLEIGISSMTSHRMMRTRLLQPRSQPRAKSTPKLLRPD